MGKILVWCELAQINETIQNLTRARGRLSDVRRLKTEKKMEKVNFPSDNTVATIIIKEDFVSG